MTSASTAVAAQSAVSAPSSSASEVAKGALFESGGYLAAAVEAYKCAIDVDPENVAAYQKLGSLYGELEYTGRALWYEQRAARLRKFDAPSLAALARAQGRAGRLSSCLRTLRRAMKLAPADVSLHSRYLFLLLHDHNQTPLALKQAHENWLRVHGPATPRAHSFSNLPDPARKLRIGYVSGEFHISPSKHFMPPVIENHDRNNVSVCCYSLTSSPDSLTERFKASADHWCDAADLSPDQLRSQVIDDGIDVLIERSGHIANTKGLLAFALRSAPVQVAYLNYPCTTGCREIDYLLSDRWMCPDESYAAHYSERSLYRLPSGVLVYEPDSDAPAVKPLPAVVNGYVTFGLFQRASKFNEDLWRAIAGALHSSSGSKLLVQNADRELEEPGTEVRTHVLSALHKYGIGEERINFLGLRESAKYLDTLSLVDIALDTFPYNGTTTTCACLWMGVPVVTLAGTVHASRISGAILSRIGLEDWVATSVESYGAIAAAKAADIAGLADLRSGLRSRMADSSVCRARIVVSELEDAYRQMWRRWCAAQSLARVAAN